MSAQISTLKKQVQDFWNQHPCDSSTSQQPRSSQAYFDEVEAHRYATHPHLKEYVKFHEAAGLKVLEIGCGLGTDGRQFAQSGADYHAIDLTEAAINLTRENFNVHGLKGTFQQGDAENQSFGDGTFDVVYSHGVLHHTPQIEKAFQEVRRVLKPGGSFIVMLYHTHSWNYYVNIMLLRRLGSFLLYLPGGVNLVRVLTGESTERLLQHRAMLREKGLAYLRKNEFLCWNTDGPGNPLSRVFTRQELTHLLERTGFTNVFTRVGFLNKKWVPVIGKYLSPNFEKALASRFGWHLFGFGTKPLS